MIPTASSEVTLTGPILEREALIRAVLERNPGIAVYARGQACHGVTGAGLPGYAPNLIGNAVTLGDPGALARHLLIGGPSRSGQWSSVMPPFARQLDDAELAAVATWIRSQWGNRATPVSPDMVAQQRARLPR